ncbi:cell wall-binding repeat-containing protein [Peptacetobacter sp. AB845]|uniref:cell wall-binding repeat-containing protein n=1 Tax=Peptacetobacter sp. AB845 TaxID=3388429 RepID=UPI0039C97A40
MNKKRLSVVMAGAMLASSVAPVLAAEVVKSEHSANELGLLQEEIRNLVEKNVFANEEENAPTGKDDVRNQSVYAVFINGKEQTQLTANASTQKWQNAFNSLRVGDSVKVYDKGHKEVDGKLYHYEVKTDYPKYDEKSLKDLKDLLVDNIDPNKENGKLFKSVEFNSVGQLVLDFHDDVKVPGLESEKTIILEKDVSRKFKTEKDANTGITSLKYYTDEARKTEATLNSTVKPEEFYGFVLAGKVTDATVISSSLVKEYTITPGGYNFDVADLYDGLFLTDKGNEFFGMLKDNIAAGREGKIVINDDELNYYEIGRIQDQETIKALETQIFRNIKEYNGVYRFEIRLSAKDDLKAETYTISGKNKQEVARLASWMLRPQARVDKFEGSNRYETAVLLAKEYAGLNGQVVTNNSHGNTKEIRDIVLVNGNALVDGLAAAPLASSIADKTSRKVPMLLTEADHLPKATVKFLKELMADHLVGNNKSATIHLVGGESVLNKSLEKELRGLGFKIERYDGDNREETSLLVMDAVRKNNGKDSKAFVVGAEGEADAMSISAVAADQKTPIVVAKKGGISEDAVYELKGMDTTIVGGKTVVTARDENALREEAKSVNRIYGDNRKATNAKVIEKYYNESGFAEGVGRAQNVIVAKDGQRRPIDLVDALAAANMAATKKAPIVLATSKLSKEQESAINSYAKDAYGLFQVGGQVNKEVVRTIAKMLNLTNR